MYSIVRSMIVPTIIVSLTIQAGFNVVVGRGVWQVFNRRIKVRLPDCCRSTGIRIGRENGGFMLGRIRFIVKTTVLCVTHYTICRDNDGFRRCGQSPTPVSKNCRGVGSADGLSGKTQGLIVFTNELSLGIVWLQLQLPSTSSLSQPIVTYLSLFSGFRKYILYNIYRIYPTSS